MFFSRMSAKGTGRRWTSRDGKTSPTLAYTEEAIYTEGLGRGKERRNESLSAGRISVERKQGEIEGERLRMYSLQIETVTVSDLHRHQLLRHNTLDEDP